MLIHARKYRDDKDSVAGSWCVLKREGKGMVDSISAMPKCGRRCSSET